MIEFWDRTKYSLILRGALQRILVFIVANQVMPKIEYVEQKVWNSFIWK